MRRLMIAGLLAAATALTLLNGCTDLAERAATASTVGLSEGAMRAVPTGARLQVRLESNLTSETAQVGDPWGGTLTRPLTIGKHEVIPAGSIVRGAVTGAHPAGLGTRAMLDLVIQDVSVAGASRRLTAGTEAILADLPPSPADAAPTARAVRSGRVQPLEKGNEVVLDSGTELVFTVKEHPTIRG